LLDENQEYLLENTIFLNEAYQISVSGLKKNLEASEKAFRKVVEKARNDKKFKIKMYNKLSKQLKSCKEALNSGNYNLIAYKMKNSLHSILILIGVVAGSAAAGWGLGAAGVGMVASGAVGSAIGGSVEYRSKKVAESNEGKQICKRYVSVLASTVSKLK
jgi:malonyl CoA-acyl carrier protein transacylase